MTDELDKIRRNIENGKEQGAKEKNQILDLFSHNYFVNKKPKLNQKPLTQINRKLSHSKTSAKLSRPMLVSKYGNNQKEIGKRVIDSRDSEKSLQQISEFVKYKENKLYKEGVKSQEEFIFEI